MADPTAPAAPPIETLLQQRTQYEQWLARLDAAGNGAPDAVRRRVRGDPDRLTHAQRVRQLVLGDGHVCRQRR